MANLPASSEGSASSASSLIPLTSSLYVPAQLTDPSRVLVDVGTGYYVEQSTKAATDMYKRKITFVDENLQKLQTTIERKQDNLRTVGEILQVVSRQRHARSSRGATDIQAWPFDSLARRRQHRPSNSSSKRPREEGKGATATERSPSIMYYHHHTGLTQLKPYMRHSKVETASKGLLWED